MIVFLYKIIIHACTYNKEGKIKMIKLIGTIFLVV